MEFGQHLLEGLSKHFMMEITETDTEISGLDIRLNFSIGQTDN